MSENDGSDEYGTPLGLQQQATMLRHPSGDSSGTITDAEDARLQFVIFLQYLVIKTEDSLVLADRATFQLFDRCG